MAAVGSINAAKERAQSVKPLLLAEFEFDDGFILRLSTDPLRTQDGGYPYAGFDYLPRVENQDLAVMQAMSESGIDQPPNVSLELSDPDKMLWLTCESMAGRGFKGARLTLRLVMWDVGTADFSTDSRIAFLGICDSPRLSERGLSITASSLLQMNKTYLPPVRIQRRCPWIFPRTAEERAAAHSNPDSLWYECGYSPENGEGVGGFTDCNFTKADCQARGMFELGRFGGIQYVGAKTFKGRAYDTGKDVEGANNFNEGKYNDFVPFVYGKGWIEPPIMNVVGDPNYTRGEAVLCLGEIDAIDNVVVNDAWLPPANTIDMTPIRVDDPLFRYNVLNRGDRNGTPGMSGNGDPYGSMAAIEFAVYKKLADSASLPRLRVLLSGPKLPVFIGENDYNVVGAPWNQSPIWQAVDILTWSNWRYSDMRMSTAIAAADVCSQLINYTDLHGQTRQHERFSTSLIIRNRKSAAELLRGLRAAARLLIFQHDGKLEFHIKQTLADQQGSPVPGSNYNTPVASKRATAPGVADGSAASGYVAYRFDESNILDEGTPDAPKSSLTISQAPIDDVPNTIAFSFQDEDNQYFTDSITERDTQDIARARREVSTNLPIEGIQNYDQAKRVLASEFSERNSGNPVGDTRGTWVVDFKTTVKAAHLRMGHIVMLSNEHYGIDNQLFRILSIQPTTNFNVVRIRAAWHSDNWYLDAHGYEPDPEITNPRRDRLERPAFAWQPNKVAPLAGDALYGPTELNFAVSQKYTDLADNSVLAELVASGYLPVNIFSETLQPPFARQGTSAQTGGTIKGDRTYWIQLFGRDASGAFTIPSSATPYIRVVVPGGTNTNTLTVPNISWAQDTAGFAVFAGENSNRLTFQTEGNGTPASITLTTLKERAWGAPDGEFDRIALRTKRVIHAGTWGAQVAAVTSNTIQIAGAAFDSNQFANCVVSLVGRQGTSEIPLFNAKVASNNADTLTITGLAATELEIGDVLVMRIRPTVGADYIEDLRFVNCFGPDGLTPDVEAGYILRCIAGKGRGWSYVIKGNTATRITIEGAWIEEPDETSVFIVEESKWQVSTETNAIDNKSPETPISIPLEVTNLAGSVLLVQPVALDGGGAGLEHHAPLREVYLFGNAGNGIGGPAAPGNVTLIDVRAESANSKGVVTRLKYKPPVDDESFAGIHVFVEAPDQHGDVKYAEAGDWDPATPLAPSKGRRDMGTFDYKPEDRDADGVVTVTLDPIVPPSADEQTWRAFAPSYSEQVENPPTLAVSKTYVVNPIFGVGEEFAPHIKDLAVALKTEWRGDRWQYEYSFTWLDPTKEQYPDRFDRFAAVNFFLAGPDGQTRLHRVAAGVQRFDSGWLDIPNPVEHWKVEARSEDPDKNINTSNRFLTPKVEFDTPARPVLADVQNFDVHAEYGKNPLTGDDALILTPEWDEPVEDPSWGWLEFWVYLVPHDSWVHLSSPGRSGEPAYIEPKFYPLEPELWRFRGVSVDRASNPKYNDAAGRLNAPGVEFYLSPPPPVADVQNFDVSAEYGKDPHSGNDALVLTPTWDEPVADDSFGWIEFWTYLVPHDAWVHLSSPGRSGEPAYIEPKYYPLVQELWRFRAVSVNRSTQKPKYNDAAGRLTAPGVEFYIGPPPAVADVQNFQVTAEYGKDHDGKPALVLTPTWDEPVEDPSWGWLEFWVYIVENNAWVHLASPGRSGEPAFIEPKYYPTVNQTWRFRAISVNTAAKPKYNDTAGRLLAPMDELTIGPPPPVGNVTGWAPVVGYAYDEVTGDTNLAVSPVFVRPNDSGWAALELRIKIIETGGWIALPDRITQTISENPAALVRIPNDYLPPPGVEQTWRLHAVSVDVNGKVKFPTLNDPGDSPYVDVTVTSNEGATGEEYCDNPTFVSAAVFYPERGPDGIEMWGLIYTVTPPTDPRYRGCNPILIDATNKRRPLGRLGPKDGANIQSGPFAFEGSNATYSLWFPGRNNAGQVNSLAGDCPKVTGLAPVPQTDGKINLNRVDLSTVDSRVLVKQDGKFGVKVANGNVVGIGANGLELNGVPMDKAIAGTYDETVFAPVTGKFTQIAVDFSIPKVGTYDDTVFGPIDGKLTQIAVDFGKPKNGTYDPQLFAPVGNVFKLKYSTQFKQTASGLEVQQIDAGIVNAGILRVGSHSEGAAPYIGVYDHTNANALVGWIGVNNSVRGGWFKNLWIGGTSPADAKIYIDGSGTAQFSGTIHSAAVVSSTIYASELIVGNFNNTGNVSVAVRKWNGATNDLVAWFGTNGQIYGGWAKEFYIGGTSPANAKIYCDALGNAWFSGNIASGATITAPTITGGTISGTTFNGTSFNVGTPNGATASGVYAYKWNGVSNELVAWFGSNAGLFGGWAKEFYIGGTTPATAKIYCDSAGNAVFTGTILASQIASSGTLVGNALQLSLNGVTTYINNQAGAGLYSAAGLRVLNNSTSRATTIGDGYTEWTYQSGYSAVVIYSGTGSPNPGGVINVNDTNQVTTISMLGATGGFKARYVEAVVQHETNGVKVLGSRRTGWTAPSGFATRTGFNTSTATTQQVAEALKALIDDLINHGMIGA